jgi:hypothetical protein
MHLRVTNQARCVGWVRGEFLCMAPIRIHHIDIWGAVATTHIMGFINHS